MTMQNQSGGAGGRRLYKPREAQIILALGNTSFYKLVADGKLPLVKIGRGSFVDSHDIDRFIDGLHGVSQKADA